MREIKQTATIAASLPIIALTAACWGSVMATVVDACPVDETRPPAKDRTQAAL